MEHKAEYFSPGYMCDAYRCSCGWEGSGFFDGQEWAYDEWKKHVKEAS